MSITDTDARLVAALLAAVRSGERVHFKRDDARVAVLLPQAEYERLQAAAGDAWVPSRPFLAAYRAWREGTDTGDLLEDPAVLTAWRAR